MRISDWSSDVCSSDLSRSSASAAAECYQNGTFRRLSKSIGIVVSEQKALQLPASMHRDVNAEDGRGRDSPGDSKISKFQWRSEENTSELQSLMRISYAVFCLKKKQMIYYILEAYVHYKK